MNNYMNYQWYRNNSYMNNFDNTNDLFSPREGFEKGNIFKNLYSQYTGYEPSNLKALNDREKRLFELSAVYFAAHDLNLYLDMHPDDQSMFMLFMDYEKQANRLTEEYERMYGPLSINSDAMDKNFTWESDKWPWEGNNV